MKITWSLPGHSGGGAIDEDVLNTPLPADRDYSDEGLCYGHYVSSVERVLTEDGVVDALAGTLCPEDPPRVVAIHVAILKHGHFYHPACMTLLTDEKKYAFVINLAVTPDGGECARGEFALLKTLHPRSEALPCVQLLRSVTVNGQDVVLFIGEWFEGYHEFHQTQKGDGDGVVVWADQHHHYVSRAVEISIYRQAARILTQLYDPLTFTLVQPWHHAAGDFVVNIDGESPEVKLITVRQYLPMGEIEAVDAEDILEGALFFLMLLSIRNRLDRYDGIGDVAWVGDHSVAATIDGFFDAMGAVSDMGPLSGPFVAWIEKYLDLHTEADFQEMARTVVASFNPRASEMETIVAGLSSHVSVFYRVIQNRKK